MIPTMYNVLYNGNLALEEGKKELSEKLVENYFEILPVELEALSEGYQLKGEGYQGYSAPLYGFRWQTKKQKD